MICPKMLMDINRNTSPCGCSRYADIVKQRPSRDYNIAVTLNVQQVRFMKFQHVPVI